VGDHLKVDLGLIRATGAGLAKELTKPTPSGGAPSGVPAS
jgi:hypothetical protein